MKRQIGAAMLVAVTAFASVANAEPAACGAGLLMKFDENAFAYESNYNSTTFISAVGSNLNVVGLMTVICNPLFSPGGMDASDPNNEYTFLFTGLTSAGTVGPTAIAGGSTRWTTNYGPGTFLIYQGSPRNAPVPPPAPNPPNADVPAKYTDGVVVLSGTLTNFRTTITRFSTGTYSTSFRSDYNVTGGTKAAYLAGGGTGLLSGAWCANDDAAPGVLGLCGLPQGYSSHPNGKFDIPATPTQKSTWGAIKQLYR
jgi:hypothetical protein